MYNRIIHQLQVEKENTLKNLGLKPFLETGLGGLASEVREMILINLLATPPPYGGREFRAQQTPMIGQPPTSLKTFVDLKASYLPVLQTCRQVYLEAFAIFYSGRSYYLANSEDLATFAKFGGYQQVGPKRFRFDTITSLCLKSVLANTPRWNSQQIDHLMSQVPSLNRGTLEAERSTKLDARLCITDFGEMKSLRKICLCMRVGQEWEYLEFLFNMRGFQRGVIDFVDNFHWTMHSQNATGDDWNLQYAAICNMFYRKGKHFEELSYSDVAIQGEVLNIDSRASDLVEGDERWVEVDIGSRNYEEEELEYQRIRDIILNQASESQQGLPDGGDIDVPTEDLESEDLHGQIDWDDDGTPTDDESNQESDDLQGQPLVGTDGEEVDDEPDWESAYSQNRVDDDGHNPQAESGTNQEPDTLHEPSNETYVDSSAETMSEQESEERQVLLNLGTPTAAQSNRRPEDHVELVEKNVAYVQEQADSPQTAAMVPEGANRGDLDARPGEETEAITGFYSDMQYQNQRDNQTQTEPAASRYRNVQTQTEAGVFAEDSQSVNQIATTSIRKILTPDQGAGYQQKVQSGLRVVSKNFQDSANSQLHDGFATKSLQERHILPISCTERHLHGYVRAAALILALSLLYMVLYGKLESTLGQLLALLLFVLMFLVALWSD